MMRRCDNKMWKAGGNFKWTWRGGDKRKWTQLEGTGAFAWPDRRQRGFVGEIGAAAVRDLKLLQPALIVSRAHLASRAAERLGGFTF
jgi:hypothetical protein